MKHYPGLALSADAPDIAFGEPFRLRERGALLREFDMYEACGEGFAEPTEYVGQMINVTLGDGASSQAWTYVYSWPVTDLPRIASGRFLRTWSYAPWLGQAPGENSSCSSGFCCMQDRSTALMRRQPRSGLWILTEHIMNIK